MKQQDIDPRLVLDTTPVLIFSARPDGYIDYFNQRCLDYLGVPLEALEGGRWTNFIHPDDLEEHLRRWRTAIASGEPAVSQARVRKANGEYRWLLHHTEPLRDETRQPRSVVWLEHRHRRSQARRGDDPRRGAGASDDSRDDPGLRLDGRARWRSRVSDGALVPEDASHPRGSRRLEVDEHDSSG